MPIFTRLLDLPDLLTRKSFFLFGPRATGKSFLVSTQLADRALVIDLLRSDVSYRLAADPTLLEALIGDRRGPRAWIVIDEVQKLPALLDEVHRLIESRGLRFLLTGSSARKLKRGQANLLAGRAWTATSAHLGGAAPLRSAALPALGRAAACRPEPGALRGARRLRPDVPAGGNPGRRTRAPPPPVLPVPCHRRPHERADAEPRSHRERCGRARRHRP